MRTEQKNQTGLAGKAETEKDRAILADLGLGAAERAALRRQGFVSLEFRGQGQIVFKLRFRLGGRQRVRYVGADADRACRVQQALFRWQQDRRRELALGRLSRDAASLLRDIKRRLEPHLNGAGLRFHGRAIRRPRGSNVA